MANYDHALKIINRLVSHGHIAYFAGGWVRDLVMERPSEDIDIATSATPEQVVELFSSTILVGIQFGVVVVLIEGHPFEVATFRKDLEYKDGRKPEQIEHTTPKIDALRRDFTINGMFYDPIEDKIHDYVDGVEDIKLGIIRAIGNPYDRIFEDRLRMVRAFRFAARFNFHMDSDTEKAIEQYAADLFPSVAMERIWQELCKMSDYPHFDRALIGMHRLKLLPVIFPDLEGLPLHQLEKQVEPLQNYPKDAPKALFLMELFPEVSHGKLQALGKYLKASNKDLEFLSFYKKNFPFDIRVTRFESAQFYSHPFAEMSLNVFAARLGDKEAFLKAHEEKRQDLKLHILRIQNKTPVLSSQDLTKIGVKPGIAMGQLLKEGEKLAIEMDLHTADAVLNYLRTLPHASN